MVEKPQTENEIDLIKAAGDSSINVCLNIPGSRKEGNPSIDGRKEYRFDSLRTLPSLRDILTHHNSRGHSSGFSAVTPG